MPATEVTVADRLAVDRTIGSGLAGTVTSSTDAQVRGTLPPRLSMRATSSWPV